MPTILNARCKGKQLFFCILFILPRLSYSYPSLPYATHFSAAFVADSFGTQFNKNTQQLWENFQQQVYNRQDSLCKILTKLSDTLRDMRSARYDSLSREALFMSNRTGKLTTVLNNLESLKRSPVKYAIQIIEVNGTGIAGTYYDTSSGEIVFAVANAASFVHEITHGKQFENHSIAFRKDSIATFGDDIKDEIEAYQAQFAFDPDTLAMLQSSSRPDAFTAINASWVKGLTVNGIRPYADGGPAHLALKTITIYSSRRRILKAYRYFANRKSKWPRSYKTISDPNIYYKQ